jgi:hypothetical protein
MLSRGEVAIIKAEIERLEKALTECTDCGIKKLPSDEIQSSPTDTPKQVR